MNKTRWVNLLICLLIVTSIWIPQAEAEAEASAVHFDSVKKMLIADGFDEKMITDLYNNPKVYFETKGVSLFVVHREATLNYDQFTSTKSIKRARRYMKKYKPELEKAAKEYGVGKEVVISRRTRCAIGWSMYIYTICVRIIVST